jgi:glycosyltransferase involved in cell wall biosynthesis
METELVFALPAQSAEISGGNLYNAQLLRALGGLHPLRVTTVSECRDRVERGLPGCYFVDSLDLASLVDFPAQQAGQAFGLMVHHLPSLEPGIDAGDPVLALERAALARCDVWLATSPFTAALLRERGYDADRILTVIPAPPSDAPATAAPQPPFVFLIAGNLIPRKGILELFECLATRLMAADRFHLELAGRADLAPEYAHACLALAQTAPLNAIVRYLGSVPYARMGDCYQRAAAFVSASRMETFGMALQEARAHGLPILALDAGYASQHFTHGESGLSFESADALAQQMLAFVREPARMRSMFENAQRLRVASDYTWAQAAELFLNVLPRALAAAQRSGRTASTGARS